MTGQQSFEELLEIRLDNFKSIVEEKHQVEH